MGFVAIFTSVISVSEPVYGHDLGVVMPAVVASVLILLYTLLMFDWFIGWDYITLFMGKWNKAARELRDGKPVNTSEPDDLQYEDCHIHLVPYCAMVRRVQIGRALAKMERASLAMLPRMAPTTDR